MNGCCRTRRRSRTLPGGGGQRGVHHIGASGVPVPTGQLLLGVVWPRLVLVILATLALVADGAVCQHLPRACPGHPAAGSHAVAENPARRVPGGVQESLGDNGLPGEALGSRADRVRDGRWTSGDPGPGRGVGHRGWPADRSGHLRGGRDHRAVPV